MILQVVLLQHFNWSTGYIFNCPVQHHQSVFPGLRPLTASVKHRYLVYTEQGVFYLLISLSTKGRQYASLVVYSAPMGCNKLLVHVQVAVLDHVAVLLYQLHNDIKNKLEGCCYSVHCLKPAL